MGVRLRRLLACYCLVTETVGLSLGRDKVDGTVESSGCSQHKSPFAPGSAEFIYVKDGFRKAKMFIPSGYEPNKPYPLLLSFHDFTSSADLQAALDTFIEVAEREKFLVVYPEGIEDIPSDWNKTVPMDYAGFAWKSWNAAGSTGSPGVSGHTCNVSMNKDKYPCYVSCGVCNDSCWWTTCTDDVGFVGDLLNTLERSVCVDKKRIYGVGFGNGGKLMYELGTHAKTAKRFEALVSVAGLPNTGFPKNTPPTRDTPRFLGIWGIYDTVVPAFSNLVGSPNEAVSSENFYYLTVSSTLDIWSNAFGKSWNLYVGPMNSSMATMHSIGMPKCMAMGHKGGERMTRLAACLWEGKHEWPHFATRYIWRFLRSGKLPAEEPHA